MRNTYEGSGMRAAEGNSDALKAAEAELQELEMKLRNGGDINETMKRAERIRERIKALREDRARIGEAGMV